jgi:rare lipoprotein A
MKRFILFFIFVSTAFISLIGQDSLNYDTPKVKILYGTASFYSNKFVGRKTASGEIFSQEKMTAACNVLPFGTWIKVTNLKNGRSVIVKTNDRLHAKVKRVVDLTRSAARQLGFINSGLTKVKVEVIGKKKP